jgi:hypothetical protein
VNDRNGLFMERGPSEKAVIVQLWHTTGIMSLLLREDVHFPMLDFLCAFLYELDLTDFKEYRMGCLFRWGKGYTD